ncbi:uncharacterized protein BDR25DRAFT_355529 [Lindgomyces ingoldianus]|uniref:Uncharacterized protein n=1 Tax=Lindgomyces ingoldianus TaxID=673940 RepID=A0ACB6QV81_9PLEO|nr:uncharacterized protein BDR25DRAFT_355529 [Lindgomyces ingoldianus]KAF2470425.1 hypothetical protein BDR25DRAFT_355529 [Lindgomyces ingoldianus]
MQDITQSEKAAIFASQRKLKYSAKHLSAFERMLSTWLHCFNPRITHYIGLSIFTTSSLRVSTSLALQVFRVTFASYFLSIYSIFGLSFCSTIPAVRRAFRIDAFSQPHISKILSDWSTPFFQWTISEAQMTRALELTSYGISHMRWPESCPPLEYYLGAFSLCVNLTTTNLCVLPSNWHTWGTGVIEIICLSWKEAKKRVVRTHRCRLGSIREYYEKQVFGIWAEGRYKSTLKRLGHRLPHHQRHPNKTLSFHKSSPQDTNGNFPQTRKTNYETRTMKSLVLTTTILLSLALAHPLSGNPNPSITFNSTCATILAADPTLELCAELSNSTDCSNPITVITGTDCINIDVAQLGAIDVKKGTVFAGYTYANCRGNPDVLAGKIEEDDSELEGWIGEDIEAWRRDLVEGVGKGMVLGCDFEKFSGFWRINSCFGYLNYLYMVAPHDYVQCHRLSFPFKVFHGKDCSVIAIS